MGKARYKEPVVEYFVIPDLPLSADEDYTIPGWVMQGIAKRHLEFSTNQVDIDSNCVSAEQSLSPGDVIVRVHDGWYAGYLEADFKKTFMVD